MTLRIALSAGLLFVSFASAAGAGKLDGKRPADRILTASDAQRAQLPASFISQAIRRHGLKRAAMRADFLRAHTPSYSKELPFTPIRNQASSGRCWIFTAMNVIERDAQLRTNTSVKLSRAWINAKNLQATAYQLLKSGESIVGLRAVAGSDVGEGGHFAYALQIVDKYGVVPESEMRDFYDAKSSGTVLKALEAIVVDAQEKLLRVQRSSPASMAIVQQAQAAIDRTIARGFSGKDTLPETFTVGGKAYTPKTYAAEVIGAKASDYITLADQRAERTGWQEFGTGVHTFEAYNTGNVEIMKAAIKEAIDQGKKVYVSLPVNANAAPFMTTDKDVKDGSQGIMSLAAYDYASVGVTMPTVDRATNQKHGLYAANHAMTITGYDLGPDGKVVKWKVENSWGATAADRGIQHVYDDYLTALVGVVTVPRSVLSQRARDLIEAEKKLPTAMRWEPK